MDYAGKIFEGNMTDDHYCMKHTHMKIIHNIFLIQNHNPEAKAVESHFNKHPLD